MGMAEFEFWATFSMVKSETTKPYIRAKKAMATNSSWATLAGRARAIQAALPRWAPIIGRLPWMMAVRNARIRAKCPISAVIVGFYLPAICPMP